MQKVFSTVLVAFIALAGGALAQTFTLKHPFKSPDPGDSYNFGVAVAPVGNNVLVGEPNNASGGSAYLFDGDTGERRLTFSNLTPGSALFGRAVAGVGNNVLIGAPGVNGGVGAAYLFDGLTGAPLDTFTIPNSTTADLFGWAVAGVGNNVLIGTPFANGNVGAAYLFDGTTGDLLRKFTIPRATNADQFGFSVAGVGNNVLIGAPGHDSVATNAGAAYLFDGSTPFAPLRKFANPSPSQSDQFGSAVAGLGINVLVGAPLGDTPGSEDNIGAAYLYDGTTGGLLQPTYLNPAPPPSGGDLFGYSVAALGNNVLIGAPGVKGGLGAAYLLDGSTGTVLQPFPNSGDPTLASGDQFGFSVAAAGNNIIIGAPYTDDLERGDAGAVYLYLANQNQPPVANAGPDRTVECASAVETLVKLDGSGSSDPENDPLLYMWRDENGNIIAEDAVTQVSLALGTHTFELTVDDGNGGTHTDYVAIKVADTAPPTITLVAPVTLWPANRKYTTITVAQCVASVSDGCAGSISVSQVQIDSVSSDEPDKALDSAIVIAEDCQSVELRADRDKFGNGRVYTLNLMVKDPSGNVATAFYKVSVPPGMNEAADDDGPHYTVLSNCATGLTPALAATIGKQNIADMARKEAAEAYQPEGYTLLQNYPNPFNPETEIRFALPEASHAVVKIFSVLGENIRTLADAEFPAGSHVVRWNARNDRGERMPSGVYFYQLVTPGFSQTMRMILSK